MPRCLRLLVLLAGLSACVRAVPARPPPASPAPAAEGRTTFRVLTLNTAHGTRQPLLSFLMSRAAVEGHLEGIGRVLAREQADVVALQEVHRAAQEGGLDHLARMAQASRYPHRFFGEHLASGARGPAHGTALLSSLALAAPRSHDFRPHPEDDKGYVVATVSPPAFGGLQVDVVSLHLDPFSASQRARQMEALVREFRQRSRPLVVMGDFNIGWGGGVGQLARSLGLKAWRPASGERTYPVFLPVNRIDWILVSPELRFASYRTFRAGVTDHCGVVAELELMPGVLARWQRESGGALPAAAATAGL